jgi:hypothetical protein
MDSRATPGPSLARNAGEGKGEGLIRPHAAIWPPPLDIPPFKSVHLDINRVHRAR